MNFKLGKIFVKVEELKEGWEEMQREKLEAEVQQIQFSDKMIRLYWFYFMIILWDCLLFQAGGVEAEKGGGDERKEEEKSKQINRNRKVETDKWKLEAQRSVYVVSLISLDFSSDFEWAQIRIVVEVVEPPLANKGSFTQQCFGLNCCPASQQ